MSDRVDRHPQKPTELPIADTPKTLPDEAENKKTIFGRIIKKIGSLLKWIKNKVRFKNNTEIFARQIEEYVQATQEIRLTSLEYQKLAKTGMLSNNTLYIITDNAYFKNIENLPLHVKFLQNVTITNSPELTDLPPDFTCLGDVTIQKCSNFNIIDYPKGILDIHGILTINKCNSFSDLPPNLNSDAHIINCKNFRTLLAGNHKNLTIEECENFHKISSGTVTENLSLIKNKKFKYFPDNLTVVNLNVISCFIESFASEITILGNLLLKSCSALRKAESPNIKLMGDITIDDCYNFVNSMYDTSWPLWICSPKDDGSLREMRIYMKRKSNFVGIHVPERVNLVSPSLQDIANGEFTFNVFSIIEFFIKYAGDQGRVVYPYIARNFSNKEVVNIRNFLVKLRKTNDYKTGNIKLLSQQVVKILSLLQGNVDKNIQKIALDIIETSATSRIISDLDYLVLLAQKQEAINSGDTINTKQLLRKYMIIVMADELINFAEVKLKPNSLNILELRLRIKKILGIPIDTHMLKSNTTIISDAVLSSFVEQFPDDMMEDFIESGYNLSNFKKKYLDYIKLPVVYVEDIPECDITCNTYMMVEYKGRYYTYDAFLECLACNPEEPTDPFTRIPIDMRALRRIQRK